MSKEEELARKIVDEIVDDLSDRSGLGNKWDQIDEDVKNEIIDTWADIVFRRILLKDAP